VGDRRLGEAWTPAQRVKNDALYAVASMALWATRRLSAGARRRLGRTLGRWAARVLGSSQSRAQRRLHAAFGDRPPVTAKAVFEALGEDLAQTVGLLRQDRIASDVMPLSAASRTVLDRALAGGRGVVFATAHLGPIDVMAASVAEAGYPVATLARESYDPRFTALYDALRKPRGIRTIYRGRPGMEAAIVRALRQGHLVGFPMDLAGRGMPTQLVPFLGERAPIPVGPARIALLLGSPVVVGTPEPVGERLQITVESVAWEQGEQAEDQLTRAIVMALERRIRAMPAHWPWMHGG
jgi:Kdo2-lipid IVA lauroyltransferase/acyltransferase